jgi:LysR family transcriptional regulator, glycine cleavage system transcriptional activator
MHPRNVKTQPHLTLDMRNRLYDLPPLNQLEAFEAAARHLSFTKAAEELSLTQSAVSRQIAAVEQHFEVALFRRLHRALLLTEDGQTLHRAVSEVLARLHQVSGRLRAAGRVKTVVVTTTPGFAGLWLIPRLAAFVASHPDVDVRISAGYQLINLNRDGVDVAVRYKTEEAAGPGAMRLFGEQFVPVCSPELLRLPATPLAVPQDLRHHVLLHLESDGDAHSPDWPMWLRIMQIGDLKPAGTLHFSQYDQIIQAAVSGQGVALGRLPLVAGLIEQNKLVAPFKSALCSPRGYFLVQSDAGSRKAEVQEFVAWLRTEADATARGRGSAGAAVPATAPAPGSSDRPGPAPA